MKRIDRAIVRIKDNKVNITLYQSDWDYNDELEYFEMANLEDENNFAIGCYEVFVYPKDEKKEIQEIERMIKETKKEIEEMENSKWNEEEAIQHEKEFLEYLEEEKKKIEKAEYVKEILMDYSMGRLRINYNGKDIEIEDNQELIFKNLEIKIEKF